MGSVQKRSWGELGACAEMFQDLCWKWCEMDMGLVR